MPRQRESSPVMDIKIDISPAAESETARSATVSIREEAGPVDVQDNPVVTRCLSNVTSGLKEREGKSETSSRDQPSSCTIFRIPQVLRGVNSDAEKPELVSIGPYHWGDVRLSEFEERKWFFLKSFLRRTDSDEKSLIKSVAGKAISAWDYYSEPKMTMTMPLLLNFNFMDMMLLDGCFVVELLLQICRKEDEIGEYDPILKREGIIPILIRDLLKLENQLPYFLLQSLFDEYSSSTKFQAGTPFLSVLALRVFNLAYPRGPRPNAHPDKYTDLSDLQYQRYSDIKEKEYDHLLDLFCFTLFPANSIPKSDSQKFRPSDKSIPGVTQLRPCGIKFKSKKTERLLDISFRKRVLEIPYIAVNDFMVTVLINCIALERCQESRAKSITDYVSFMHCLINQPKDVSLLCSDGIISTFSHDDQYVVELFNELGKRIVFNVEDCYLAKQFGELDSYYYSNWGFMIRTYFSSPWTAISVFYAFLILALTAAQAVYAVLGHYFR